MKCVWVCLFWLVASPVFAAGKSYSVNYPPSTEPGELTVEANYYLWIPDAAKTVRGVIVHQHGCGDGAEKGGRTAADDLHWQALAKKWDCALLGSMYQAKGANCRLWCDSRNGSDKVFLKALADFARQSGHPEIERVPWCLWGHSGGAFWASLMTIKHPERVVAVWLRSGTAYSYWEKGEIPKPDIPEATYQVPMVCNPGAKEKDNERFNVAWTGGFDMFKAYRAKGSPACFAPDPRTAHECGDSRYFAIPYFNAMLALRLPEAGSKGTDLRPVEVKAGWLADALGTAALPPEKYSGDALAANWFPNERIAKAWSEYVQMGATSDATPPTAPTNLKAVRMSDGQLEITWTADADFESGLQGFVILRGGQDSGRVPEKSLGKFGRPLFQVMSYHDTPEAPLPEMKFVVKASDAGAGTEFRVVSVNSVGLKSEPSDKVLAP